MGASDPVEAAAARQPDTAGARRADRVEATAELVLDITAGPVELPLDALFRDALDRLHRIVAFDSGSVALVDGDRLVVRATNGSRRRDRAGGRVPRTSGRRWQVVHDVRPLRLDRGTSGAWLGVPIQCRDESLGLLELESEAPATFTDEDERLVATVGRALAGPVDAARQDVAEQRARELREAFTGVISHELRTPITTIYGMSQVLRQRHRTMEPAALRQMISDIEGEADRLRRLAEDLLVLSRTEGGRLPVTLDPILIGHVVRRRIADESSRWPAHRFSAEIPPGIGLVLGEEMYVEQVVQNLLSNAAKYSPPGSEIRAVVEQRAGEVDVRVLDEGIGLADQSPERLFELFYRDPNAARQASGAGIGLFVSRQLIESMGGRIWARQREGVGSEFGFALPLLGDDVSDEDDATG